MEKDEEVEANDNYCAKSGGHNAVMVTTHESPPSYELLKTN